MYARVWRAVGVLASDPFPPVARVANDLVRAVQETADPSGAAAARARIDRGRERRGVFAWSVARFSAAAAEAAAATAAAADAAAAARSAASAGRPRSPPAGAALTESDSALVELKAGGGGSGSRSSSSVLQEDPLSEAGARALHWRTRAARVHGEAAALARDSVAALAAFREVQFFSRAPALSLSLFKQRKRPRHLWK
jgi:hypothetical protein